MNITEKEKEVVIEMLQFFYDNGWINDSSQLYFNSLVEKTLNGEVSWTVYSHKMNSSHFEEY